MLYKCRVHELTNIFSNLFLPSFIISHICTTLIFYLILILKSILFLPILGYLSFL